MMWTAMRTVILPFISKANTVNRVIWRPPASWRTLHQAREGYAGIPGRWRAISFPEGNRQCYGDVCNCCCKHNEMPTKLGLKWKSWHGTWAIECQPVLSTAI